MSIEASGEIPKRSRKRPSRVALRNKREDLWWDFRAITLEELTPDRMRALAGDLIARAAGGDIDVLMFLFGQDRGQVAGVGSTRQSPDDAARPAGPTRGRS